MSEPLPPSQSVLSAPDLDAQETREWLDALTAVIEREGPERAHFLLEQLLEEAREHSVDCRFRPPPVTSTPSSRAKKRPAPASWRSRGGCAPTCAGTRWRWWSRRTGSTRPTAAIWVATSVPSSRWRTCWRRVSTTSGTPTTPTAAAATAAICSTCRATARPASTPAPSWKGASARSNCSTSAKRSMARACRATRTPS